MTDEFDYVIVGSGAAGAAAARVLAESGRTVAIIEEGPEVSTEQFEDRALTTFARLYRGRGAQVTRGRAPMLIIQGCCVGGSTVVNSAIMRRLPEEVWREWEDTYDLSRAFSFAEIESASDRIESELQVGATPTPIWGGNNRALHDGAASAGIEARPTRRNAPGCRGSARCNLGCPHGAKQSMQLSYVPRAVNQGARLFSAERAEAVVWSNRRAVGVQTAHRLIGASRAVVLAASAVQTPDLLWRSGIRTSHVGRHFQGHPGMAVVGLFDQPIDMGEGATQGMEVDAFRQDTRFKLETLAVPPETFFAGMPGVGRRWVSLMAEFGRAAVWVLPLRSRGEGIIRGGSITFRLAGDDLPNLRRGLRQAAELMFAAGAREVVCPVHGLPDRLTSGQLGLIERASDDPAAYPLAMSHLFGTARMSPRPAAGVVGADFRVHGTDNLYVVDSAVFPTNLGVNPQLAIMAVASIAAERVLS